MLGTIAAVVALAAIIGFIYWLTPTDDEYNGIWIEKEYDDEDEF